MAWRICWRAVFCRYDIFWIKILGVIMTMSGPDPVLIEILIAFVIGAVFSAVVLAFFIGTGGQPHCGMCICP